MVNTMRGSQLVENFYSVDNKYTSGAKNLSEATINTEYIIKSIETKDDEMKEFLFTLGCYKGEPITVISVLAENLVITVKDARYSIDKELAEVIKV